MNRVSADSVPAYSLRLLLLCPLLLLLVAAPALAQTETPTTTATTTAAAATPTGEDTVPAYQFVREEVENLLDRPQPRIFVTFTSSGAAAGGEQLLLRFAVANALTVVSSTLDGQAVTPLPQADEQGYAWGNLPTAAGDHTLVIDVTTTEAIDEAQPALSFIDSEGQTMGTVLPFSGESIANLLGIANVTLVTPIGTATLAPTPTGTATSVASPTPTPTKAPPATPLPTNTQPVVPLPTGAPTTAPGTATPAGGAGGPLGGDGLAPLLIGGLFLLALLAIGGLLLLRRRRPRPVAPRPAGGRPTVALPPMGAEPVTGVLTPVYLLLEGDAPQQFPIFQTPFAIGRDPSNQLVIDETFPQWQTVSREHAILSRHERGYVIEDLGSQNGVRVNGQPTPKNLLRNGWQVSVGGVNFRFVDETQAN